MKFKPKAVFDPPGVFPAGLRCRDSLFFLENPCLEWAQLEVPQRTWGGWKEDRDGSFWVGEAGCEGHRM